MGSGVKAEVEGHLVYVGKPSLAKKTRGVSRAKSPIAGGKREKRR